MKPGALDRRIIIQRATSTPNALNEPINTWADLKTLWARRQDVTDGEKFAADQVGSFLMSRFVIRSTALTRTITAMDRVSHDDVIWAIKGAKETKEGRNRFIELTCAKDAD